MGGGDGREMGGDLPPLFVVVLVAFAIASRHQADEVDTPYGGRAMRMV